MRFELYKILDRQYVDDLMRGYLYMNPLNYFRDVEGNDAQGDFLEGTCGAIRKDQLKNYRFHFDPKLTEMLGENVALVSDYYGLNNLFCLYQLLIDDTEKKVWAPSEKLCRFNDLNSADKVVVRIKDTERFLYQIECALQNEIDNNVIEYGVYGNVAYSNVWMNADGPGTRSVFHKDPSYSYQNEWRLCILRYDLDNRPYQLSIGDLSDISETISLDQFLLQVETLYPAYEIMNENAPVLSEKFKILGSINAVSHLMFSYIQHPSEHLHRSDQAQAVWHYAQYLELNGEKEKVDSYIETCMKDKPDLDHLELLVEYRLLSGEWVKATDAFMFFINETPDVIKTDPVRFFFPLHNILMQHQQPADAAQLYYRASKDYFLEDKFAEIMRSDFLFALGFYDQVIPLFKDMKKTNIDPILDYNLAVSHLHVLDMKQAYHHLQEFRRHFSRFPYVSQKATQLQTIIDCFYYKKQLELPLQQHVFQELTWNDDLEWSLSEVSQKTIYIGVDVLYQIEKVQRWDMITQAKQICVCPLTVARILELYQQSGDPIFFHIINRLIQLPNIKVCSPELKYYLTIDLSNPILQDYLKMEQAMLLQESMLNGAGN